MHSHLTTQRCDDVLLSVCLLISQMVCAAVDTESVLGLHLLGPNAGEVLQGFSAAMK